MNSASLERLRQVLKLIGGDACTILRLEELDHSTSGRGRRI
jgi:hypothetical protein